ncbi:MAG TPA: CRISPR-associated endonuclease Cas1 [Candidatus Ozemobacteraceae bacterium]|nr:CRISPR-associated endonuclease Cas1 [Candidatus Ozemobacteraceae bacterium]
MQDAVLYVSQPGARLTRTGERLIVRAIDGKIVSDVPMFRLDQVICFGTVEPSGSALLALSRRGIDLVFLSQDGRFKARIAPSRPRAVQCRVKQYQRSLDPEFRLTMARTLVGGKLNLSRVWLLRQNRNRDSRLTSQILGISGCIDSLREACSVDQLMGIEGTAARYHFEALKLILKQDLGFNGRVRRPPKDPVNALLSFGYTLLFNRVVSAVEQVGLDPMISNLHGLEDRRPSLALDLMEEFRTLIVDSVVVGLINRMEICATDFDDLGEKGVQMKERTLARFVKAFQDRLNDTMPHPREDRSFTLRDLIVQQAYQYKSVILGEASEYQPMTTR